MPATEIIIYKDADGSVPVDAFLDAMPQKAMVKCIERIEELERLGHEMRRPHADFLRDGIYELRAEHLNVNYRILYFFHGREAVVVSHGCTKEKVTPTVEIDRAIANKKRFEADPQAHTALEDD